MSVQPYSPPNWTESEVVMVESDAESNLEAIGGIDECARRNGFVRVGEYWLRMATRPDGKRVFRGIWYRVQPQKLLRPASA
jgi:hypothetical protein